MTATGAAFPIMCASEMESSAASAFCQSIKGEPIDKSVSDLLLQTMISMALDVALTVQQEIHTRLDEVDRMRHKQVERARYEAELADDLPRLWQHPQTPDRERKRMIRLLLEDVTLIKRDQISVHVRFKGGVVKTLSISGISESRQVSPQSWNRGSNLRSVRRGA